MHDPRDLPSFDQLPVESDAPDGTAWGLFGDNDELGCLNLITPERVAAAAKLVRKGAVFAMNLRIDRPDPPLFGRGSPRQTMTVGPRSRDDYIDNLWPQASSQWDSLRHIRHPDNGFYNGVRDEDVIEGGGKLGIDSLARTGIAGRGVLLDVGRYLESRGRPLDQTSATTVTKEDLAGCADAQGVSIETGDVLLIRTGWLRWYLEEASDEQKAQMAGDAQSELKAPGLGPCDEMAAYLWDLHIAAIAADNPALEVWPPLEGFMHFHLIPGFGMPIGELWYMEELAADCAADSGYEFFFMSAPMNVPGGVGSPPNALAIK